LIKSLTEKAITQKPPMQVASFQEWRPIAHKAISLLIAWGYLVISATACSTLTVTIRTLIQFFSSSARL
jgi:hypothetical protein